MPATASPAALPLKPLLRAGLLGGLLLNLIDTPWSVLVMVPRMAPFAAEHGLEASPLVGPWFLLVHILFAMGIALLHLLLRQQRGPGPGTALLAGLLLLALNRLFGFGSVLLGAMPAGIFLGFSLSFVPATLAAAWLAGRVLDRAAR
jgi:hypothetical protein